MPVSQPIAWLIVVVGPAPGAAAVIGLQRCLILPIVAR